jgi:uncharacterized protein (TIGR03437 family)
MDAANQSHSKTALLLSLALLMPAGAIAQTTAFNVNGSGTATTTITLLGNQSNPVTVASTTTPTTEITYSATTSYAADSNNPAGVKWLCLNPTGPGAIGTSCDNYTGLLTPNTLYIQIGQNANSSQFPAGAHSAIITLSGTGGVTGTITVNYTTGSSGGGGTNGTLFVTPSSPAFTLPYGSVSTVSFTLLSSSNVATPFTLQPPSIGWAYNFVTSSGLTTGSVNAGNSQTLFLTLNGVGQPQTVLTTTLSITYGSNTLSVPITFGNGVSTGGGGGGIGSGSLQLSQSTISWSYSTGGGFPGTIGVTASSTAGAIGFGVTSTPSNSWFSVAPTSGTLPQTLNIAPTGNMAALATGTYTGTVAVTANDGSSANITITLTVNGGAANGLTVSPNPVSLQTPVGGSTVSQAVTVTSTTGGTLIANVTGTGLSLSISNSTVQAGVPTSAITVFGNPTGLANATYIGTLTVSVNGVSQAVQVNFVVGTGSGGGGGGGTTGSISAAPSSLGFVYQTGSLMQISQVQQVFLAGSGNYTTQVFTNNGSNWLSVSSTAGLLPSQFFQVFANASGLTAGTYTGSVTFLNTGTSQTAVVSVTLTVTSTTAVYASPGDMVFSYIGGTTGVAQFQNMSLLASDNSQVLVAAAVSNPSVTPWLTISGNGQTVTGLAAYNVTINAGNLANGLYTGYITVTASANNSPITVPVALNVTGSSIGGGGGSGSLTLSTSSLTFTPPVNGNPVTQQLTVTAASTTSFTASASTNGVGNSTWLSISPAGASVTPSTLTVTANPAGLAAGTYSGTISLVSTGTQTVQVTMIVGGGGGTGGSLTVTANGVSGVAPALTFSAPQLNATVPSQYLSVTSASGSGQVPFVASLSGSSCSWVNLGIVANQQYQTPVTVNVGATTTGLASGTYSCTLSLTPTGGTAVTVPLTLNVVGQPTISVPTTALSFAYSAGGSLPSPQTITVNGSGSSAANFTAGATSTPAGWLSVTPASGTASTGSPATLTVTANPAGLAAGNYTGTVTVSPGAGTTGSGTVTVTLSITAPSPSVTTVVNGASFLSGAVAPGELVTLMGTQLGPATPVSAVLDNTGKIATQIGNVQVFFGGTAAPMIYASPNQINCMVPYEVAGLSNVSVQVKYFGQPSNTTQVGVASSAPGVFSVAGGAGQGAIINQSLIPNTPNTPAPKGSIVTIFVTGEGQTSPAGVTGGITGNATTVPLLPIAVNIGGTPATVVFKGELPGVVAGILQLNVTVPTGAASGSAVPVTVTVGSNTSQSGLTMAIQ